MNRATDQVSGIPTPEQIGQARDILAMARLIRRNKARGYDTASKDISVHVYDLHN